MTTWTTAFRSGSAGPRFFATIGLWAVLCNMLAPSAGADPIIRSLENGILSWSHPGDGLTMFSVEWSHDLLLNAWRSHWEEQGAIVTTQSVVSVPVPMHFRVAQGFDNRAFAGAWIIYHHDGFSRYRFKTDGKGLVTEFGTLNLAPAGYYAVSPDGTYEMTLYDPEERINAMGRRLDALTWQYVYLNATGHLRKVENPDALAGVWKGTIGLYSDVVLHIRDDGFISVVSNLTPVASGSAYVDRSNTVVATLYTGDSACTSIWSRIAIRGVLNNHTNIFGECEPDWEFGWMTAAVNLNRQ